MQYRHLAVDPLTPGMGAVITDINLNGPLGDEVVSELRNALIEHLVLFFRGQELTHESHKELGRKFGKLHVGQAAAAWAVPEHPEVVKIHADADSTYVAGENWHSDMTCDERPPLGSILYMHTVPPTGGDTAFSNMFAAYEALSERMKQYLDGMTATHDARRVFGSIAPAESVFPRSSHPVIRTHPVSKRKALFVNRGFTESIDGIPKDESAALLEFLTRHVERPEFQCRFRWEPHSIAFWDNRSVQHCAIWDYFPQVRSGFRVTIEGDKPE